MSSSIQIIPSAEIDTDKWDNCVTNNANGLIYSTYHYLNAIADNWHGLIINDYKAVMALPWRKKWGIKYIYTPPFMQQSGLTGNHDNEDVLKALNKFSSYITYNFNYSNQQLIKDIAFTEHTNLILPLFSTVDDIQRIYSKSLQRNLQKAITNGVTVVAGNYTESIEWYKRFQGNKMEHVKDSDYVHLNNILCYLNDKGNLICKNALNANCDIIATIVCLKDNRRIYNLLPSSSDEGKELSAMHVLLNNIITEYADTKLIFDFEGSDIPGVQQFYKQFGSVNEPYYRIHQNNLPFILRMLKK